MTSFKIFYKVKELILDIKLNPAALNSNMLLFYLVRDIIIGIWIMPWPINIFLSKDFHKCLIGVIQLKLKAHRVIISMGKVRTAISVQDEALKMAQKEKETYIELNTNKFSCL